MAAMGVALLRAVGRHLSPLEWLAYGAPIGMVLGTLTFVPLGMAGWFTAAGVGGIGVACAVIAVLAWRRVPVSFDRAELSPRRLLGRAVSLPALVIGAFAVRWAFFWRDSIFRTGGELWAGHVNIWGDGPVHLGVVSSFVWGGNFPPEHPRFLDHPFAYHYLADLTAAAQVVLGMDPGEALALHSWFGSVLVAMGLYAFARRLTRRRGVAILATVLFLLGGGLGWLATAETVAKSGDLFGTLGAQAWDRMVNSEREVGLNNFQIVNLFFGFLASQRAFLYGLPIAFAAFSTLLVAVRVRRTSLYVLAGVIAGLLPLAHLATLLAFVLVIPALFLLFPSRRWLGFGIAAVAVALPQLLTQTGGGVGALAALRLELGWVAPPDPWPVFWAKNLGVGALFTVYGLVIRRAVPARSRRFLFGFMPIFVVVNIVAFQPWSWDNHKVLVYWLLACAILGASAIAFLWRRNGGTGGRPARAALVVLTTTMLLSGVLEDVGVGLGQSRYRMLDAQALEVAALVRERTPPDAVFVTAMRNHDPVAMLTGRRIFVGYWSWLWTEGIDYKPRREIVRTIYGDPTQRDTLIARYGIDFLVIGPAERKDLEFDEASLVAAYPVIARTADWLVLDLRGAAAAP